MLSAQTYFLPLVSDANKPASLSLKTVFSMPNSQSEHENLISLLTVKIIQQEDYNEKPSY